MSEYELDVRNEWTIVRFIKVMATAMIACSVNRSIVYLFVHLFIYGKPVT